MWSPQSGIRYACRWAADRRSSTVCIAPDDEPRRRGFAILAYSRTLKGITRRPKVQHETRIKVKSKALFVIAGHLGGSLIGVCASNQASVYVIGRQRH